MTVSSEVELRDAILAGEATIELNAHIFFSGLVCAHKVFSTTEECVITTNSLVRVHLDFPALCSLLSVECKQIGSKLTVFLWYQPVVPVHATCGHHSVLVLKGVYRDKESIKRNMTLTVLPPLDHDMEIRVEMITSTTAYERILQSNTLPLGLYL